MNISQIVAITATGKPPYQSPNGALYAFNVTFANGVTGEAQSKNQQAPPYKVGETVGYEIPGPGRLKIDRRAAMAAGVQVQPPQTWAAPQQAPQMAIPAVPVAQGSPIPPQPVPFGGQSPLGPRNGPNVGMAVNNAVELLIYNQKCKAEPVDLSTLARHVKAIAEAILDASHALETRTELPKDSVPF